MGNQSQRRGNGYLSTIRNDYGEQTCKLLKNFSKIKTQIAIKCNQRILLLRCRRGKLLPQHLQCRSSNSFSFHNDKLTRKSKFESLFRSKNEDHHRISDSWFTNLTDTHIPPTVTKTLSLGKNFGIPFPNNQLPINHLVADFESNIQKINEDKRNEARLKFVN